MLLLRARRCSGKQHKVKWSGGCCYSAALVKYHNFVVLLPHVLFSLEFLFSPPLSYIWLVSSITNAAGNNAEMDHGNEFEILEENLEIMALFFSCPLSTPQGVLTSLNNLTFTRVVLPVLKTDALSASI